MEVEDIIIVGAGISGLATALGLHMMGLRSLVLESSDSLRVTGFGLATWTNAWKALDALGISDYLKATTRSTSRGGCSLCSDWSYHSAGVIYDTGKMVLIGCDGVNSVVAKWLGLQRPTFTGRLAIRGIAEFPEGHNFKPEFLQYFGDGFRSGFIPCDDNTIYWFFTYFPSSHFKEGENDDPAKIKQLVLNKLSKVPKEVINIVEKTELGAINSSPLRYRNPWNVLWGNICKGTVCVVGDAFHPMTPDIGQGGCCALEDSVTLARCLGEALLGKPREEADYDRIKRGIEKYAKERRWRGFELIATAYMVGVIQQSNGVVLNFLRDKVLSGFLAGMLVKKADFDCGKLYSP